MPEGTASQLVCTLYGNNTLAKPKPNTPVAVRQSIVASGAAGDSTAALDLGSGIGLFSLAPNASFTLRGLRLTGVSLSEAYPFPEDSFLALRAIVLTGQASAAAAPQLRLEDLAITTPSCRALSLHQSLACRASPSANFTVTPEGLHVLLYTTRTVTARNVTVSCSGTTQVPYPCTATVANSAQDLLDALAPVVVPYELDAAFGGRPGAAPDAPLYVFLNCSMAMRDGVWQLQGYQPPSPLGGDSSSSEIGSTGVQLTLAYTNPVIIAGAGYTDIATDIASSTSPPVLHPPPALPSPASMPASAEREAERSTTAASVEEEVRVPPTFLDLQGTSSLLTLRASTRVELHNLTLLNAPLGPPSAYPGGLLALLLWTFDFLRSYVSSRPTANPRLRGRGLAVLLPLEELATWHYDLRPTGAMLSPTVTGYLCAVANGLLKAGNSTESGNGTVAPSAGAVLLPNGGLRAPRIRTPNEGLMVLENTLLLPLPSRPMGQRDCRLSLAAGSPVQPAPAPPLYLPPVPPPVLMSPALAPLCQLRPPGSPEPPELDSNLMHQVGILDFDNVVWPTSVTEFRYSLAAEVPAVTSYVNLFRSDAAFTVGSKPGAEPYQSFTTVQGQVLRPHEMWLGDPLRPRLLHVAFAPAAVNIRTSNASLTLRHLVLTGLPSAALHPTSPALGPPPGLLAPPPAPVGTPPSAGGGASAAPPSVNTVPAPSSIGAIGADEVGSRRLLLHCDNVLNSPCSAGRKLHGSHRPLRPRLRRLGSQRRRLSQFVIVKGVRYILGPPAGTDPTGGLPPGLANFSSCLWTLDFDRGAQPLPVWAPPLSWTPSDAPPAYLDSVVLLVPPAELAIFAAAAAAVAQQQELSRTNEADEVAAALQGRGTLTFTLQAAGAAETAAGTVLSHLTASMQASQLAGGITTSSLRRLTSRLLGLVMELEGRSSGGGSNNSDDAGGAEAGETTGSNAEGSGSDDNTDPWVAKLVFDSWSWCGLAGRNVTLAAELSPSWDASGSAWQRPLWCTPSLLLPLTVVEGTPSPPATPLLQPGLQHQPVQPPKVPPSPSPRAPAPAAPPVMPSDSPAAAHGSSGGGLSTVGLAATLAASSTVVLGLCAGLLALLVSRLRRQQRVPGRKPGLLATLRGVSAAAGEGEGGGCASSPARPPEAPAVPRQQRIRSWTPQRTQPGGVVAVDMASLLGRMYAMAASLGVPPPPAHLQLQLSIMGASSKAEELATEGTAAEDPALSNGKASPQLVSTTSEMMMVVTGSSGCGGNTTAPGTGSEGIAGLATGGRTPKNLVASGTVPDGGSGGTRLGSASRAPSGSSGGVGSPSAASGDGGGPDFVLLEELNRGAQGVVFRGRWRGLEVAVKTITFSQGGDPRAGGPIAEAAIAASLSHPHVVATYAHQLHRVESGEPSPSGQVDLQGREPPPAPGDIDGSSSGGELAVWRLTLVQEFCDAGSLRDCLDSGRLAGCRLTSGPLLGTEPKAANATRMAAAGGSPTFVTLTGCLDGPWTPVKLQSSACQTRGTGQHAPIGTHDRIERERRGTVEPGVLAAPDSLALPSPLATVAAATRLLQPPPHSQPPATLLPGVALLVALQVARGMAYLHSLGVLHGDVSSSNVLLKSAPLPPPESPPLPPRPPRLHVGPRLQPRGTYVLAGSAGPYGSTDKKEFPAAGQSWERQWQPRPRAGHTSAVDTAASLVGYVVKVCDFGLSGRLEGSETHISGEARRSLLYSAPELVQYGTASKASDVYAFAILLYEIACGASLPTLLRRDPRVGWVSSGSTSASTPALPTATAGLRAWLAEQEAPGAPAAALPPGLLVWPPGCPAGVAALAAQCLAEDPDRRPGFKAVAAHLEAELAAVLPVEVC